MVIAVVHTLRSDRASFASGRFDNRFLSSSGCVVDPGTGGRELTVVIYLNSSSSRSVAPPLTSVSCTDRLLP